jgi:hypothetical protein
MKSGICFRTEGGYEVSVYRTHDLPWGTDNVVGIKTVIERIGRIYFGTDKKWHFGIRERADKVERTLEHSEMHDIIGMMNTLARTDNYGHNDIRTFPT